MQETKSKISVLSPLNIGSCCRNSLLIVSGCFVKSDTESQYTCTNETISLDVRPLKHMKEEASEPRMEFGARSRTRRRRCWCSRCCETCLS